MIRYVFSCNKVVISDDNVVLIVSFQAFNYIKKCSDYCC